MKKFLYTFLVICLLYISSSSVASEDIQKPIVAGAFYPIDENALKDMVDYYVGKAVAPEIDGKIIALIAPHAGYTYSGPIAGYSFRAIKGIPYKTVLIIAPSHQAYFNGISVLDKNYYNTPLGNVPIDKELTSRLLSFSPDIRYYQDAFSKEHSAEVEIPFLQRVLPHFKLVIAVIGDSTFESAILLSNAIYQCVKDKGDILIVASTDLSHDKIYKDAVSMDSISVEYIRDFNYEELYKDIILCRIELCGGSCVMAAMMAAKMLGADSVSILKYANSGDVTSDKSGRIVGYCSAVIYKKDSSDKEKDIKENGMNSLLTLEQKKRLIEIARTTLDSYIRYKKVLVFTESDTVLNREMGAFVTLRKNGQLRGCIGNIIGHGPLYLTVQDMAIASSTQDFRFTPVIKEELDDIDIEISVLSPLEKIDDPSLIIMGRHGVIVRKGAMSGVYLPQVADETGWDREQFMNSLCAHKAGIPADSWKTGRCDIFVFSAEVFGEKESAR